MGILNTHKKTIDTLGIILNDLLNVHYLTKNQYCTPLPAPLTVSSGKNINSSPTNVGLSSTPSIVLDLVIDSPVVKFMPGVTRHFVIEPDSATATILTDTRPSTIPCRSSIHSHHNYLILY